MTHVFSQPPPNPRDMAQKQIVENANMLIEAWPILLSTASGLQRQAEDAGYPPHIAQAMSFVVLGITVHFTPDDLREIK